MKIIVAICFWLWDSVFQANEIGGLNKPTGERHMTRTEIKLNGYLYNTAALLNDLTGTVDLETLKSLTDDSIAISGATKAEINRAMFRACNLFNITIK